MDKSIITITPSRFKVIVATWTVLGLFFIAGFSIGAFLIMKELSKAEFKVFPPFTVAGVLLGILFPLVFVTYYYARFTLKKWVIGLLKWLFIVSFPLLIYVWITIYPAMGISDIFYEVLFFVLHVLVFLKFPCHFKEVVRKN